MHKNVTNKRQGKINGRVADIAKKNRPYIQTN